MTVTHTLQVSATALLLWAHMWLLNVNAIFNACVHCVQFDKNIRIQDVWSIVLLLHLTISSVSSICVDVRAERFWRQSDDGPRSRHQAVPPRLQQSPASEAGQNPQALHWRYVSFVIALIFFFYLRLASFIISYIKILICSNRTINQANIWHFEMISFGRWLRSQGW